MVVKNVKIKRFNIMDGSTAEELKLCSSQEKDEMFYRLSNGEFFIFIDVSRKLLYFLYEYYLQHFIFSANQPDTTRPTLM